MASLLHRDHAYWPEFVSASALSKYCVLPQYIRKEWKLPESLIFRTALTTPDESYYNLKSLIPNADALLSDERNASRFIKECTDSPECTSHTDDGVGTWNNLPAFFCKTDHRPDVWISEGKTVVILIAEVHLGKTAKDYGYTLNKAVISLVTQLRMLRYQYDKVNQVVGFVLPNSDVPFFVTKVTVKFKDLSFIYSFERVEDVEEAIRAAYQANRNAIGPLKPSLGGGDIDDSSDNNDIGAYPIKLTPEECNELRKEFVLEDSVKLKQVQTWNSFVLQSNKGKVYKFCLEEAHFDRILRITSYIREQEAERQEPTNRLILHERKLPVFDKRSRFLEYSLVKPPLAPSAARKCLVPLLRSTKEALDQLHIFDCAHMDIRLPNICFKLVGSEEEEKVVAVLIDFGHTEQDATKKRNFVKYESCLYMPMARTLTGEEMDFMQLGWMAVWILHFDNPKVEPYGQHELNYAWIKKEIPSETRNDPFVQELLLRGKFEDDLLNNSALFKENKQSLESEVNKQ